MKAKLFLSLALAGLALSACQDEDFGFKQQDVFKAAYENNFTKTFGNIDPNETWDFTTRAVTQFESLATETVDNDHTFFVVPNGLLDWMKNNLVQHQDNTFLTQAFAMVAQPDEIFEMFPVYIGDHSTIYELHIVVANADGTVIKDKNLWSSAGGKGQQEGPNGMQTLGSSWTWYNSQGATMSPNTHGLRSLPILVNFSELGVTEPNTTVYFYVNSTNLSSISTPPHLSTINIDDPSVYGIEQREGYETMLLGFSNQSKEFNDVVWLISGFIPQVFHDEVAEDITITKRYMAEDLTDVGDYDFNDIVVDLTQVTRVVYDVDTNTGTLTLLEIIGTTQYANLSWLCGTVPIQVFVDGAPLFNKITNPADQAQTMAEFRGEDKTATTWWDNPTKQLGWDPKVVIGSKDPTKGTDLKWNPETNNISIKVWTSKEAADNITGPSDDNAWIANFPERGTVPYIIATSQNTQWLDEGAVADADWFNGLGGAIATQKPAQNQ